MHSLFNCINYSKNKNARKLRPAHYQVLDILPIFYKSAAVHWRGARDCITRTKRIGIARAAQCVCVCVASAATPTAAAPVAAAETAAGATAASLAVTPAAPGCSTATQLIPMRIYRESDRDVYV